MAPSQEAHAVVAPSTYTTAIQVQGEDPGTEYDDWSAIPIAFADPADNPGVMDISTVQVANDSLNIYIRVTLHNTSTISLENILTGSIWSFLL